MSGPCPGLIYGTEANSPCPNCRHAYPLRQ